MPVRVSLDVAELKANPLRVGLSMDAEVDVGNSAGKMLADAPRASDFASTHVYNGQDDGAEQAVQRIIAANLGRPVPPAASPQPANAKPTAGSPSSQAAGAAVHHAAQASATSRPL